MKKVLLTTSFVFVLLILMSFKDDENDALHKREFNVSLSETRNGIVQKKVIADQIKFKNGKISSDFIKEKFGFKWIRYRVKHDTTYTDETGAEVNLIKLLATATDESNLTVTMELTQIEWDLDGVVKITKNDRLRKYYDLAGREKGGKPKKKKKQEQEEPATAAHT